MKLWIKITIAALTLWAVSSILKMTNIGNWIFFNKGILPFGIFFLCLVVLPKSLIRWREDKKAFLVEYLMGFALIFTELLGMGMRLELAVPQEPWIGRKELLIMAGTSALLSFLTEPLFRKAVTFSLKPASTSLLPFSLNQTFLIVWASLFIGYIPCVLAFFPGLCCYDIGWQLEQIRTWTFNTHHPLIHTLFAGGLLEFGKRVLGSYYGGAFLHSLIQLFFFSGSMAFAIRFLVKRKTNSGIVILTWAYFLLFPFFPVLGISTTKDILFSSFFLITFVCICDMADNQSFYQGIKLAFFLACTVLMCLFRNNAIYGLAVMAGIFFLTCFFPGKSFQVKNFSKTAICLIAVVIVLSQGIFLVLEKGLHATQGHIAEKLSIPVQQMARSYVYHQDEFSQTDRQLLEEMIHKDCLWNYKYYISDPVKAGLHLDTHGKKDFLLLWTRLGMQFPEEYIRAALYQTMGLWYMGGDISAYMEYDMCPQLKEDYGVYVESMLPELRNYYSWFTSENLQSHLPFLSLFFFTPFYSWSVLFAAGILLAKRQKQLLILPLFLACYLFTLVFGPCIIIRYILGNMMCTPVLAGMIFQPKVPSRTKPCSTASQLG